MGQKTHPKGLRLEVNKNWTSNWFPKKNAYATDLAQDIKLRKYLISEKSKVQRIKGGR